MSLANPMQGSVLSSKGRIAKKRVPLYTALATPSNTHTHTDKSLPNTPTPSRACPSPTACDWQNHLYKINLKRKGYPDRHLVLEDSDRDVSLKDLGQLYVARGPATARKGADT